MHKIIRVMKEHSIRSIVFLLIVFKLLFWLVSYCFTFYQVISEHYMDFGIPYTHGKIELLIGFLSMLMSFLIVYVFVYFFEKLGLISRSCIYKKIEFADIIFIFLIFLFPVLNFLIEKIPLSMASKVPFIYYLNEDGFQLALRTVIYEDFFTVFISQIVISTKLNISNTKFKRIISYAIPYLIWFVSHGDFSIAFVIVSLLVFINLVLIRKCFNNIYPVFIYHAVFDLPYHFDPMSFSFGVVPFFLKWFLITVVCICILFLRRQKVMKNACPENQVK